MQEACGLIFHFGVEAAAACVQLDRSELLSGAAESANSSVCSYYILRLSQLAADL